MHSPRVSMGNSVWAGSVGSIPPNGPTSGSPRCCEPENLVCGFPDTSSAMGHSSNR